MCDTNTINECLLPIILFGIYLLVFIFFSENETQPEKRIEVRVIEQEPQQMPRTLNYQCKEKENKKLKNFLIIRRILTHLRSLNRYQIYRLCMILGISIKDSEDYFPLDELRFTIKEVLRDNPKQAISALAIVLSGNHC
ncbi:MAG: hypothetical protein QNJ38_22440 [Prochloraceae cyanobacterium]|nr:hypothetical protein [Prochloraceae cyanobacterium]